MTSEHTSQLLVVEDEQIARENLAHILSAEGYQVTAAENAEQALAFLHGQDFDLVLTDLNMPGMDGLELLQRIKSASPDTEVLVITGYATVDSAVEAMQKGAYHYLAKPYKLEALRVLVARALEKRRLRLEVLELRRQVEQESAPQIIGQSPPMVALRQSIAQVAPVDCNVLILGETGTGKELVARSIHALSGRRERRLLTVNCAAFNEDLLTNELFGHEAGAYTGAKDAKRGLMESADRGTFFLDEIGDMPLNMQAKILRVIENKTLLRVGGTVEVPVDIRILAATNRNLKAEAERGAFRRDLYYRLNVITLTVPSLAERREDIPLLSNFFLNRFAKAQEKTVRQFSADALDILQSYAFPGNVRELENIVERAVIMCNGQTIQPAHLPGDLAVLSPQLLRSPEDNQTLVSLQENEQRHISRVLRETDGNRTRAAEILGIDRASLWRKLKRFELD